MKIFLACIFLALSLQSSAQDGICPLKIGDSIPNIQLQDLSGKYFNLNEMAQDKTIFVFFRGGWCPYCQRHLSALQEAKEEIAALGYKLIAISPDRMSKLSKSIDKNELDYTLLSDAEAKAMSAFGLAFELDEKTLERYKKYNISLESWSGQAHNMLPVPAIYIVNEGQVDFQYVNPNYKKRLSAEVLISILKANN